MAARHLNSPLRKTRPSYPFLCGRLYRQQFNLPDKRLPLDGELHGVSTAALDGRPRQLQTPFGQKFREAKPIASTHAPD
jgi:hypothetical protein